MSEPPDSPEVQVFMLVFHKIRDAVNDDPKAIVALGLEDDALANLCAELFEASESLREAERSRRELFNKRTNPKFITAWRDFDARYSTPVGNIAFWHTFDFYPSDSSAPDRSSYRSLRESAATEASTDAFAVQTAMEYVAIEAKDVAIQALFSKALFSADTGADSGDPWSVVKGGIAAWKRLITEMEFDLEGVFRGPVAEVVGIGLA